MNTKYVRITELCRSFVIRAGFCRTDIYCESRRSAHRRRGFIDLSQDKAVIAVIAVVNPRPLNALCKSNPSSRHSFFDILLVIVPRILHVRHILATFFR